MNVRRVGSQPSGKGPDEYFTGTVRVDRRRLVRRCADLARFTLDSPRVREYLAGVLLVKTYRTTSPISSPTERTSP
jgi:hypothetical protein